ncbi:hypothetical protein [Streptomyces altiplanensis]
MSLPPLRIPPDGDSPVFLVEDICTTVLSTADTGGELSAPPRTLPS